MKKKNQKNLIIILILFILLAFVFYFFIIKKEEPARIVLPSLEEITNNINNANKHIAIEEEGNKIINHFGQASESWDFFYENFRENIPEEYKRSRDFGKNIWQIKVLSNKAYELSLEGKLEEAKLKSNEARDIYLQIKKENNIQDMSDELLRFYRQSILLSQAKDKAEITNLLPNVKISFTGVKEKKDNKEYVGLIDKIEKLIMDLDRQMDGPVLRQAQKDILVLTKKLYLNN